MTPNTSYDTVSAATTKKEIDECCGAVRKLFFVNSAESLLPAERVADATEKIERGYRLLDARKFHPEFEESFAALDKACASATKRMTGFKERFCL